MSRDALRLARLSLLLVGVLVMSPCQPGDVSVPLSLQVRGGAEGTCGLAGAWRTFPGPRWGYDVESPEASEYVAERGRLEWHPEEERSESPRAVAVTLDPYRLDECPFAIEVVPAEAGAVGTRVTELRFGVEDSDTPWAVISVVGDDIRFALGGVEGEDPVELQVLYDPGLHRWWRCRMDGDELVIYTAGNCANREWVEQIRGLFLRGDAGDPGGPVDPGESCTTPTLVWSAAEIANNWGVDQQDGTFPLSYGDGRLVFGQPTASGSLPTATIERSEYPPLATCRVEFGIRSPLVVEPAGTYRANLEVLFSGETYFTVVALEQEEVGDGFRILYGDSSGISELPRTVDPGLVMFRLTLQEGYVLWEFDEGGGWEELFTREASGISITSEVFIRYAQSEELTHIEDPFVTPLVFSSAAGGACADKNFAWDEDDEGDTWEFFFDGISGATADFSTDAGVLLVDQDGSGGWLAYELDPVDLEECLFESWVRPPEVELTDEGLGSAQLVTGILWDYTGGDTPVVAGSAILSRRFGDAEWELQGRLGLNNSTIGAQASINAGSTAGRPKVWMRFRVISPTERAIDYAISETTPESWTELVSHTVSDPESWPPVSSLALVWTGQLPAVEGPTTEPFEAGPIVFTQGTGGGPSEPGDPRPAVSFLRLIQAIEDAPAASEGEAGGWFGPINQEARPANLALRVRGQPLPVCQLRGPWLSPPDDPEDEEARGDWLLLEAEGIDLDELVRGGRLLLTPDPDRSVSPRLHVRTREWWEWPGCGVLAEFEPPAPAAGAELVRFRAGRLLDGEESDPTAEIRLEDGQLHWTIRGDLSAADESGSMAYDPDLHRWWRIRVDEEEVCHVETAGCRGEWAALGSGDVSGDRLIWKVDLELAYLASASAQPEEEPGWVGPISPEPRPARLALIVGGEAPDATEPEEE